MLCCMAFCCASARRSKRESSFSLASVLADSLSVVASGEPAVAGVDFCLSSPSSLLYDEAVDSCRLPLPTMPPVALADSFSPSSFPVSFVSAADSCRSSDFARFSLWVVPFSSSSPALSCTWADSFFSSPAPSCIWADSFFSSPILSRIWADSFLSSPALSCIWADCFSLFSTPLCILPDSVS